MHYFLSSLTSFFQRHLTLVFASVSYFFYACLFLLANKQCSIMQAHSKRMMTRMSGMMMKIILLVVRDRVQLFGTVLLAY